MRWLCHRATCQKRPGITKPAACPLCTGYTTKVRAASLLKLRPKARRSGS